MDTMYDHSFVDISGLAKASVLSVLYNFAELPRQEYALLPPSGPSIMTSVQAETIIMFRSLDTGRDVYSVLGTGSLYFDDVYGRRLGVDITHDAFNPSRFDMYNGGAGSARVAIDYLRTTGKDVKSPDCDAETWTEEMHAKALQLLGDGDVGGAIAQLVIGLGQHPDTSRCVNSDLTRLAIAAAVNHGHSDALRQTLVGIGA